MKHFLILALTLAAIVSGIGWASADGPFPPNEPGDPHKRCILKGTCYQSYGSCATCNWPATCCRKCQYPETPILWCNGPIVENECDQTVQDPGCGIAYVGTCNWSPPGGGAPVCYNWVVNPVGCGIASSCFM